MINVLVVDDDADIRMTVKLALETLPADEVRPTEDDVEGADRIAVEQAVDSESALAALAARRFDVVLLDVMLPGLDGYSVLQALRRDGVDDVGVVMLTARGREAEVANAFRSGADAYVTKPFDVDELARVTREVATAPQSERRLRRRRELERAELLLQLEHNFDDPPPPPAPGR